MAMASTLTSTTPNESFRKEMTNVNQEYFAQLIGKSGSRLKEIKSQFKPESSLDIRLMWEKSLIVLTAKDSQTVDKCEKILLLMVKEIEATGKVNNRTVLRSFCKLNSPSMTTYIDPNNNNKEIYSYSLYLPKKYKGRVIGSGGKNIDWILNRYENVSIEIDFDDDDLINRTPNVFVLANNPEVCRSAYNRLREFCNSLSGHKDKGNHKERVSGNLV